MDRVSVPLWGTFLSEPLPIVALVGRYPANQLIGREPIRRRHNFQDRTMQSHLPSGISRRFHRLSPGNGHVAHALRTLPPVAARVLLPRAAPRLACVKPAASVHPEPGSNSSLYITQFPVRPRQLIPYKKSTLFIFVLGTCCTSFSLFNELVLHSCSDRLCFVPNGNAKVGIIFKLANFFAKIFNFFCSSEFSPEAPKYVSCPYTGC